MLARAECWGLAWRLTPVLSRASDIAATMSWYLVRPCSAQCTSLNIRVEAFDCPLIDPTLRMPWLLLEMVELKSVTTGFPH